ncbi:MAG: G8 domain-containing protein [Planctomycetota bacterium]
MRVDSTSQSVCRLLKKKRKRDRSRRPRKTSRRQLLLQGLETRQLLAANVMVMDDGIEMTAMMGTSHHGMLSQQHSMSGSNSSSTSNDPTTGSHRDGMHSGGMQNSHVGHSAAMNLVSLDQATHVAESSGVWTDPRTWKDQVIPVEGAHVVIPEGISVTVDSVLSPSFKTVRIDGVLEFATDRDTELKVDTLVSTMSGQLIIGTETNPIDEDHTASIVFADDGAIDRTWDPSLLSRGALLHGTTTIHGAAKTSFGTLADSSSGGQAAVQGSTQITLSSPPDGWQVGDWITIAGVDPNDPEGDEVVQITDIDGVTVTFADQELLRDHVAPRDDLQVHVANLSRNVQFSSENTDAQRRGHIMFMHTNDVDVRYASFQGLGRTDKSIDLEDWQLVSDSEGSVGEALTEVEDLGGFNVRGRYSVHFHRGGFGGQTALVQGSVVRDDPGWAYVNHSSTVDFIDNVSHNITGAAYNTEAGDEEGSFIRNIAIRTFNPNGNPNPPDEEVDPEQEPDARVATQSFGWQGDGFWFHGPGVTVEGNVVSGASGHGFIYWTLGLVERGRGENLVDAGRVPGGDLIGEAGKTPIRPKQVPVPSFDGNAAYNVPKGLSIYYLHTDNRDENDEHFEREGLLPVVPAAYENQIQSTFSNFLAWNVPLSGIAAPYAGRLTFENIEVIGTGAEGSIGLKLDQFANENDLTVRNIKIDGYLTGIAAQRQGNGVIDNAEISALTGIRINVPESGPRDLQLSNLQFLPLSDLFDSVDSSEQVSIDMDAAFDIGLGGGLFYEESFFDEPTLLRVPGMFQKDRITLTSTGEETVGLYFDVQDKDFVPVVPDGELSRFVRPELVGLTNEQLQEQFGFSFSDAVTPESAMTNGLVQGGLVGPALGPFTSFPPVDDTYWIDYLAELGVGDPGTGEGDDTVDEDEDQEDDDDVVDDDDAGMDDDDEEEMDEPTDDDDLDDDGDLVDDDDDLGDDDDGGMDDPADDDEDSVDDGDDDLDDDDDSFDDDDGGIDDPTDDDDLDDDGDLVDDDDDLGDDGDGGMDDPADDDCDEDVDHEGDSDGDEAFENGDEPEDEEEFLDDDELEESLDGEEELYLDDEPDVEDESDHDIEDEDHFDDEEESDNDGVIEIDDEFEDSDDLESVDEDFEFEEDDELQCQDDSHGNDELDDETEDDDESSEEGDLEEDELEEDELEEDGEPVDEGELDKGELDEGELDDNVDIEDEGESEDGGVDVDDDFHNNDLPEDVNNDGRVSALDALVIINRLSQTASGLLQELAEVANRYFDVNDDSQTTALDALLVINYLSRLAESIDDVDRPSDDEDELAAAFSEDAVDQLHTISDDDEWGHHHMF